MKYKVITLTALIGMSLFGKAQTNTEGVKIGPDVSPPDPSAILEIESTNKGVLFPNVNLESINNDGSGANPDPIVTPADGLFVYNLSNAAPFSSGYYYWDGSTWLAVKSGTGGTSSLWEESTTDPNDIVRNTGNVGIGIDPTFNLHTNTSSIYGAKFEHLGGSLSIMKGTVSMGNSNWVIQEAAWGQNMHYVQKFGNDQIGLELSSYRNTTTNNSPHYSTVAAQNGTLYVAAAGDSDIGFLIGGNLRAYFTDTDNNFHLAGIVETSDSTLKTNILPLQTSLDKIKLLNGVTYNWKDPLMSQKTQHGLIAQEVELIYPDLVSESTPPGSSTPVKGLNYTGLIAPLIEAIKEQQAQIEVLEQRIEALENP